jgi:hypothetical protein
MEWALCPPCSLLQPREDTRDYISSTVKKGVNDVASTGKRWTRRAQASVDDVKATVAGAVEAGKEAYRTVRDA